jgi:hypothetical protein
MLSACFNDVCGRLPSFGLIDDFTKQGRAAGPIELRFNEWIAVAKSVQQR